MRVLFASFPPIDKAAARAYLGQFGASGGTARIGAGDPQLVAGIVNALVDFSCLRGPRTLCRLAILAPGPTADGPETAVAGKALDAAGTGLISAGRRSPLADRPQPWRFRRGLGRPGVVRELLR